MRKELILGLALALGSTGAMAATFDTLDTDGNGEISKDEFYGSVADWGVYSDWDTNDDGLLDEDEFNSLGYDVDYVTWDLNDDGYLDSGEVYDGVYSYYDVDDDGYWDDSEWEETEDDEWFDIL